MSSVLERRDDRRAMRRLAPARNGRLHVGPSGGAGHQSRPRPRVVAVFVGGAGARLDARAPRDARGDAALA